MGYSPGFLLRKRPNFDPCEFTRNRHRQSRNDLEIILEGFRRRFREFGAISRTYQNRPCSKPWAMSRVFSQKRPNQPKSTQTVAPRLRNKFRWVSEAFQRIWIDFQNLPKSAMFKTMGYVQGFCSGYLLKNGQISTLANSPEIDTDSRASN